MVKSFCYCEKAFKKSGLYFSLRVTQLVFQLIADRGMMFGFLVFAHNFDVEIAHLDTLTLDHTLHTSYITKH